LCGVRVLEKGSEAHREASKCFLGEIGGTRRRKKKRIFLGYYDLRVNHRCLHYGFHR